MGFCNRPFLFSYDQYFQLRSILKENTEFGPYLFILSAYFNFAVFSNAYTLMCESIEIHGQVKAINPLSAEAGRPRQNECASLCYGKIQKLLTGAVRLIDLWL